MPRKPLSLTGKKSTILPEVLAANKSLSIVDSCTTNRRNIKAANKSLHREILLSYRLLFGQDKSSRGMFNNLEIKKAGVGGILDPVLVQLCGQPRQLSKIIDDDTLVEQDFYDNVVEFPFFGPELIRLQKYVRSRKPRQYLDVWRDTRDPFQWLTLWLLVIIGGLAMFFSFLQSIASVIQIVRSPN